MFELEKVLNLEFIGRAFRNLSAVGDAGNFKSHLQTAWLADSHAPCWSGAALPRLPELPAPGTGRGPQSHGAPSRLCALRESPEQCERGAERARPKGVTSLRCLIRRSACAARAPGAPVTAEPRGRSLAPCLRRRSDRVNRPWVPDSQRTGMGGWLGTPAPSCRAKKAVGVKVDSLVAFFPLGL